MNDRRPSLSPPHAGKPCVLTLVVALLLILAVLPGCPSGEREQKSPTTKAEAASSGTKQAPEAATGKSKGIAERPGAAAPPKQAPSAAPALRAILLVVDGLRPEDVTPARTPALCRAAHCPGTPDPDPDSHATRYAEARDVMLAQTNANHVAMVTGEYAARSGIVGNAFYDRRLGRDERMDQPALIAVPTLFDLFAAERERRARGLPRVGQPGWDVETEEEPKPAERGAGSGAAAAPAGEGKTAPAGARALVTAGLFGKEKLRRLFDCTRRGEACGTSDANPEGDYVTHVEPDVLGGSAQSPAPGGGDCPAEPAASYGVAQDGCIMDRVLETLDRDDPTFVFVNLGRVDFEQHAHGPGSPEAIAAVAEADRQVGRLVAHLKERGRWARTVLFVLSDHSFSRQSGKPPHVIDLRALFDADRKQHPGAWGTHGGLTEPYTIVDAGGSAMVLLTALPAQARHLSPAQSEALQRMRQVARFVAPGVRRPGVSEALYRLPNERDRGHTLAEVHPDWHLDTPRAGDLLVMALASPPEEAPGTGAAAGHGAAGASAAGGTGRPPRLEGPPSKVEGPLGAPPWHEDAGEHRAMVPDAPFQRSPLYVAREGAGYIFARLGSFAAKAPGNHGQPGTRHIPFIVLSGGDFVVDREIDASAPGAVNVGDDTAALPEQAEVVDVAPTVLWLTGLLPPDDTDAHALLPFSSGRVLREAFNKGVRSQIATPPR